MARRRRILRKIRVIVIGQIKAKQNPFTTEALGHGVLPLFFSMASCLRGSKNVQPIPDQYKKAYKRKVIIVKMY
jgi:hypothetical protein